MISNEEFYRRLEQVVPGFSVSADGESYQLSESFDIYFERLSMDGLNEMHRYSSNEKLYEFFEFDAFKSKEETKAYIKKLQNRMSGDINQRSAMYWFVRRKIDGYLIGTAGLVNLDFGRKSVEWGYGIDPELWGEGYILQLQEILKHYVFETLQLNRLYGTTMAENSRTISSILSAGLQQEGLLRDYYCKNGVFHDGWHYSMLKKDYLYLESESSPISGTDDIVTNVIEVVSSVFTDEDIDVNSSMNNVPSWDSMNHMLVMLALKEKMGINFSPLETTQATSIQKICDLCALKNC